MSWCFAIVNNRLAEIYFDMKKTSEPKIMGHCYVKKEDFKTKEERDAIKEDTAKYRFVYRNREYKEKGIK